MDIDLEAAESNEAMSEPMAVAPPITGACCPNTTEAPQAIATVRPALGGVHARLGAVGAALEYLGHRSSAPMPTISAADREPQPPRRTHA